MNPGDLQAWIENWAQENSSAVEVWGREKVWKRIKGVIDAGGDIKSISVGEDTESVDLRNWVKKHLEANPGYKKLAFEDNISSAELILYKLPDAPAQPSMQKNPKVAAVEQLLSEVSGFNDDGTGSTDVGSTSGQSAGGAGDPRNRTQLAQVADEVEDTASMIAGLIDRSPEFADSPVGRGLFYSLDNINKRLVVIAEQVEELAEKSYAADERSERLPSMSNTPAAESVTAVNKFLDAVVEPARKKS